MGVFKKMDGNALCALLHKNFEVDNPNRAAVAMQVIERGRDTDDPLAWLACVLPIRTSALNIEKRRFCNLKNTYRLH